jgi:hypothetical protein
MAIGPGAFMLEFFIAANLEGIGHCALPLRQIDTKACPDSFRDDDQVEQNGRGFERIPITSA